MTNMSGKTVFERLGITYEEKNGFFYPLISQGTEAVASVQKKYA